MAVRPAPAASRAASHEPALIERVRVEPPAAALADRLDVVEVRGRVHPLERLRSVPVRGSSGTERVGDSARWLPAMTASSRAGRSGWCRPATCSRYAGWVANSTVTASDYEPARLRSSHGELSRPDRAAPPGSLAGRAAQRRRAGPRAAVVERPARRPAHVHRPRRRAVEHDPPGLAVRDPRRGFTSVRTGAVTEAGADVLQPPGLHDAADPAPARPVADRLDAAGAHGAAIRRSRGYAVRDRRGRGSGRPGRVRRAWAIDRTGIDETCEATPSHRAACRSTAAPASPATVRRLSRSPAAPTTGYLQRLAVHPRLAGPRRRPQPHARLADAGCRRRRLTRAVVNTHTDNDVALDLYRRVGFRVLPQGLSVLDRRLDDV